MQGSKCGAASGRLSQLGYVTPQACKIATLTLLLTGCLETASVLKEMSAEASPFAPRAPTNNSSISKTYSDDYWDAVANLDLVALRQVARTDPEIRFADGVASLVAGDPAGAETAFRAMSSQESDPNVAAAAQLMFAATLMYERKWSSLVNLKGDKALGLMRPQSVSGIQKWGSAFAALDSQIIDIPRMSVTLPLGRTRLGTPTIRVRINGKEFTLWLDTGSSITVLSSDVAADARVAILGADTLTVATFAGIAPARPAVVKRIEIGSIILTNTPAIVIDSRLMRLQVSAEGVPWGGLPVDGIIGWDTIRRFDITMDFEKAEITLARPETLGTNGTPWQNLMWFGRPLIRMRAKSGTTLHFSLDTGSQGSFLSASILKNEGVAAINSSARPYGIARNGGSPTQAVPSLSVEVAGRSLVLRGLMVYASPSSGLINCDGILGSDIAKYGTIRIDATNGLFSVGT